jgi:hypothetical protein
MNTHTIEREKIERERRSREQRERKHIYLSCTDSKAVNVEMPNKPLLQLDNAWKR